MVPGKPGGPGCDSGVGREANGSSMKLGSALKWQVLEGVESGAGAQGSRQARLLEEPYLGRQRSFLARPSGFLRPWGTQEARGLVKSFNVVPKYISYDNLT